MCSITEGGWGESIHSLQQQLGEQITMVRAMAYVDGPTGLANRAAYDEYVNQLNGEIRYRKASFAIGIFDLNGLKETNDMDFHMVFNRAEAEMYYDKRDYYRTHQDRRRHT